MELWKFIKRAMLKHPDQTLCERDSQLTFKTAVYVAETFGKQIKNEDCCAIICESEINTAIAILSCFSVGVTAVPLSIRYGEIHCNNILDAIKPSAVIIETEGKLEIIHTNAFKRAKHKKHPALIMCTSGTTGKPKGVMLSENNIISNLKDICAYFNIGHNDSILIARPLYHCAVLTGEFLISLIKGVKIFFHSEMFNPAAISNIIHKEKITTLAGTPTLFNMLTKLIPCDKINTLKNICVSGECLSECIAKNMINAFPNAYIYHVYGQTEAGPRICYLDPSLFNEYPTCVGFPLNSITSKILDDNNNEVKVGEEGVLWIKGPNVMIGYYNDIDSTKKVIKKGWLCTGDIARINNIGLIEIKGRKDNLIIKAGMNIYPQEIESAIKIDPRVSEVLVYGMKNKLGNTGIAMKISGNFSNVDEVRKMCFELLPSFQIPTKIEILDNLQKSASGKLKRGVN